MGEYFQDKSVFACDNDSVLNALDRGVSIQAKRDANNFISSLALQLRTGFKCKTIGVEFSYILCEIL